MRLNLKGFTLVELLVTMAILGILATVGFGQYRTSQKKGRDVQRKADLDNIARGLELYYNDHNAYPVSTNCATPPLEQGKIVVDKDCPDSFTALNWGDAFQVTENEQEIIYMKQLPIDPTSGQSYCYFSDGTGFKIYAKLENSQDSDCGGPYTCNGVSDYCYGVTSPNQSL